MTRYFTCSLKTTWKHSEAQLWVCHILSQTGSVISSQHPAAHFRFPSIRSFSNFGDQPVWINLCCDWLGISNRQTWICHCCAFWIFGSLFVLRRLTAAPLTHVTWPKLACISIIEFLQRKNRILYFCSFTVMVWLRLCLFFKSFSTNGLKSRWFFLSTGC